MKKKLPGWVVLLIITLAAGLALGATNALTKEPIAEQARIAAENARKAALPDADAFEEVPVGQDAAVDWVYAGLKDGTAVGYVAQKTVNGFGGKVEVIAGVNTQDAPNFTLGGVSVGGSDFAETAGLGARAKEPAFTSQFTGKTAPVSFIKAGGERTDSTVDALTSATITTTAVVNGVNDIVKYIKADVLGIAGVEMPALPAGAQAYSSSAQGFRGPVYVEAAFEGSRIVYLSVGDESFAEDIGVGVKDADFMYQFIGKTAPVDMADVDAISGATISSTAVVKALNEAYTLSTGGEIIVPETPVMPELPEGASVFSATEQGFRGPVYVEAAFDENGVVTYLKVGDEAFAEDIGAGVKEADFMFQFIGKAAPVDIADVDTITGATISSTAVVNALNKAYNLSQGIEEEPVAEITLPEKPAEGVVAASAQGFGGPVAVEAAFDEDGRITYISIGDDAFAETPGLGARALEKEFQAQFIGKQMPLTLEDIDALSGATVTSAAVVNALNEAYQPKAQEEQKTLPEETAAPTEAPAPAPTEEPAPEKAEKAEKDKKGEKQQKGENAKVVTVRKAEDGIVTVDAISFFTLIEAKVNFVEGSVVVLSVADKKAGSDQALAPSAQEKELKDLFYCAKLPLDVSAQKTPYAAALASAINQAYAVYGSVETAAKSVGIGEYSIAQKEDGVVTVEAISFFTQIKANVFFMNNKVLVLSVADKPAGSDQPFAQSALEKELSAQFQSAVLPLDVTAQKTPYAIALASAINQAYAVFGSAKADAKSAAVVEAAAPVLYIAATFEGGTLKTLSVKEKNAQGVLAASKNEQALQDRFVGKALPLEYQQDSLYEAAVAAAINSAFTGNKVEPAVIQQAETPEENPEAEAEAIGEVISFFSAIQVKADFDGRKLTDLRVYEMPVGGEQYAQSSREEEMRSLFLGQELPLDTAQQSAFASAVAAAINQVYAASGNDEKAENAENAENAEKTAFSTGSCICFFTDYYVYAEFDGKTLQGFSLFENLVGSEQLVHVEGSALYEVLAGCEMPLNAAELPLSGEKAYVTQAVVIALNQAYENFLSGQQ